MLLNVVRDAVALRGPGVERDEHAARHRRARRADRAAARDLRARARADRRRGRAGSSVSSPASTSSTTCAASSNDAQARHARDPRRTAPRSRDRRGDHADLRDLHLRAEQPGRAPGPRLRALAQSDALGVRALRRGARVGNRRLRVLVRHGDDGDRARAARQRRARRRARRSLRRHAATVRARAEAQRRAALHLHPVRAGRRARSGDPARDADGLGRVAVESAAQARRPRSGRGDRAPTRNPQRRGQYVRVAVGPASARARLRPRRALGDQVPQRPLGRDRRRGGHEVEGARREARVPAERDRLGPEPVRRFPGDARA